MKALVRTILAIAVAYLVAGGGVSADDHEAAAERAARTWLGIVDRGQYALSWQRASPLLRRQVTRTRWVEAVANVREPFGRVLHRSLRSAAYRTELPGAPDGEYVVLQFNTEFEKKREAVETVTEMRVGNDWQASGYFLR